jgi:hypothetical protein
MTLQGKGFFTYILPECEHGEPAAILAAAMAAGLSHVLVKIADGPWPFGIESNGSDYTAPVVRALRESGIAVWGWHYVYGTDPDGEAKVAIQRARNLGLDGYVVDAEGEYKKPGRDKAAHKFMSLVRSGLDITISLCSYRFPDYHPELPWSDFLEFCDYHMPQVYWEQAHNAGGQLRESKRQCDALPNAKPFLATGAAYGTQNGWSVRPDDVVDFLNTAKTLTIPAVNFFSWDYSRAKLPGVWKAISDFSWPVPPQTDTSVPPPVVEPPLAPEPPTVLPGPSEPSPIQPDAFSVKFLAALNSFRVGEVTAFYITHAVHVRRGKISRSPVNLRKDYAAFFASLPVGSQFTLTGYKSRDDARYLTFRVDTRDGKISLIVRNNHIEFSFLYLQ